MKQFNFSQLQYPLFFRIGIYTLQEDRNTDLWSYVNNYSYSEDKEIFNTHSSQFSTRRLKNINQANSYVMKLCKLIGSSSIRLPSRSYFGVEKILDTSQELKFRTGLISNLEVKRFSSESNNLMVISITDLQNRIRKELNENTEEAGKFRRIGLDGSTF